MEQIIQKPSLPIKTKIAAWWMLVVGVIGIAISIMIILWYLSVYFGESWGPESGWALIPVFMGVIVFLPSLFFLFSGIFLFKKKRGTWRFAIGMIIFLNISSCMAILKYGVLGGSLIPVVILSITLFPFILLLLDRKNFWKIAT